MSGASWFVVSCGVRLAELGSGIIRKPRVKFSTQHQPISRNTQCSPLQKVLGDSSWVQSIVNGSMSSVGGTCPTGRSDPTRCENGRLNGPNGPGPANPVPHNEADRLAVYRDIFGQTAVDHRRCNCTNGHCTACCRGQSHLAHPSADSSDQSTFPDGIHASRAALQKVRAGG